VSTEPGAGQFDQLKINSGYGNDEGLKLTHAQTISMQISIYDQTVIMDKLVDLFVTAMEADEQIKALQEIG
jgi:hypothetical protein